MTEVDQPVELRTGEHPVLTGALHFDEVVGLAHHDVGVDTGADILGVGQIETGLAVDDSHGNGGHQRPERRFDSGATGEPGAGVMERHARAGNARGAGAPVGLQHITIDPNGVFAEGHRPHRRAKGAADQALNFLASPARTVPLARGALARGARQHRVLGGDPAFASPFLERRRASFDARGAMDECPSEANQTGSLGVRIGAALKDDRPELVDGTAVRT
jgi:hypothetical protein